MLYADLTGKIIGAAYAVFNELGSGFLERVYQEALGIELRERGVEFEREVEFRLHYRGRELSCKYTADFVVGGRVIVELKAVRSMDEAFVGQVLNYLHASKMKVGLLINFGDKGVKIKRFAN